MLMTLPRFEYFSCRSLDEVYSLLSAHRDEIKVLAGGTDLLIKMKHKTMTPRYLVDIKRIPDLKYIEHDEDSGLRIGALTTVQSIRNSAIIRKRFPVLYESVCVLGTRQVRNLATLGGNLCNASPAAECAPALLTLEARAKITRPDGERVIPLEEFFLGPGVTALEAEELLTEIQIPNPPFGSKGIYLKHSTRRIDVAIVGTAMTVDLDGEFCNDIRIALGAVGPTPFRARKAEDLLRGRKLNADVLDETARMASELSFPIDDMRGRADYRKDMVCTQVKEAIHRAVAGFQA
jgi:carbon-monoxide dehydrogenase medium subunit